MQKQRKIAVIGLGYVGLPVAVGFAQHDFVIGYDKCPQRIKELEHSHDRNGDIIASLLETANAKWTCQEDDLAKADFYIIAVPTPITQTKQPDLSILLSATDVVARYLKSNDIIVYESTVYPGTTEEECIPKLEMISGLTAGKDFFVGYSPERINPGDKKHSLSNTVKIVSAQDQATLDIIATMYENVVEVGVHRVSSIKVAEAAKVIENTQRDLNIALMNELAIIFHRLGIDTLEVLKAAETKWNFLPFRPGLVGGHCIGVDPYYLTHKAEAVGYHPQVILAGRRINDGMGYFIVEEAIKHIVKSDFDKSKRNILVCGLTFKENCPDLRNSRVFDVIQGLKDFGANVILYDPIVREDLLSDVYQLTMTPWDEIQDVAVMIFAVGHDAFRELPFEAIREKLHPNGLIIDVKGILDSEHYKQHEIPVWRL